MLLQKFHNPTILVLLFVASSIGSTFVNKYVLSVLKFTYPTVYQSWQMGFVFAIMMTSSSMGLVQLSSFDRFYFRRWLPAMFLFTAGIYSGSKALSLLPVPIFCVMYNLVYIIITMVDEVIFKQVHSTMALTGLAIGSCGMVLTVKNDTEVDYRSYNWIFVHCICLAFYSLYAKRVNKLQLKELDKITLNSSFSIVSLMFLGTVTGEVSNSLEFPFLYYNKFHAGCVLSGMTGSLLCVSYSGLTGIMPVSKTRWINSLSMVAMSFISLFLFEFDMSAMLATSVLISLTGSVLYTYAIYNSDAQLELSNDEKRTPIP